MLRVGSGLLLRCFFLAYVVSFSNHTGTVWTDAYGVQPIRGEYTNVLLGDGSATIQTVRHDRVRQLSELQFIAAFEV